MSRISVKFAVAALMIVLGASTTYSQDDLNRILERDKIVAQKLRNDATEALNLSRTLERTDPGRAAELLQDSLAKIRNAPELSADERSRLVQRLQARVREVTATARTRQAASDPAAQRFEQRLKQESREREAAAGAAKNVPPAQGPAAVAGRYFEQRTTQLNALNKQKNESAERNLGTLTSLQRGATQIEGDIQFSKDWARIAERGKQKLTEKEVAMLRALNSTLSVNFDKLAFSEVINHLSEKASISILIDEPSVKEVNLDYMDPVTFKVNKVTLRTVLQKVLKDRGLTYVLKDGTVQVVTLQKAREMMVVRAYAVNDLVSADNPLFWGPVFSRAIMLQNAQRLIDMIQASVEPSQWTANGGGGTITFQEATQSLIVRASAEMHYMLGGSGMVSR